MEEKDLIKKLEETSLPEIETPTHKEKLKSVLIEKYFQEKRKWELFGILQRAIPIGVAAIFLIGLISINLIFPRYNLAEAKEIVLKNPQIQEWIVRGAIIKDAKIIKNQAYILIQPTEKIEETSAVTEFEEIRKEEFNGALVEVNVKEKKILKIEKLSPQVITLTEEEKEKIKKIAEDNPEVQRVVPREAEILKIIPPLPQLSLIKKGESVQVLPEPGVGKRASIIYQFGKNRWEGKINLSEVKVEEVKFLGEFENNATFEK